VTRLPRTRYYKTPLLRYGSAIHRRIPLPNYDTHPHRLQFDDFVVRLRIEFGGTDEIDVIADRLTMAKKQVADVLVDTLIAAGVKRVYGSVGAGRGARSWPGAINAADNYIRTGSRLWRIYGQSCPERTWRRACQPGESQSLPVTHRATF
jgi:hypothetical protein